jgi:hypothetical protein
LVRGKGWSRCGESTARPARLRAVGRECLILVCWCRSDPGFLGDSSAPGGYEWTAAAGGTEDYDEGRGLAVRPDGSALMAGWFRSPTVDFDPGAGVDERARVGEIDMVLWQVAGDGSYLDATTWGSTFHDRGYTVALDGGSDAYVCGFFSETFDFDPGDPVDQRVSEGYCDCLLMKLELPGGACYADCTGEGVLDLFDFLCFVNAFNEWC